jgi:hypothetical protein
LLADGGQDTILLSTKKGEVGYRIIKLLTIPNSPGTNGVESVIKIYKTEQTTSTVTVDFSDNRLLGVSYYQDDSNVAYPSSQDIIFDQEIFNQDIYVTHKQNLGSASTNYYLELEIIKLDESQAMVATLSDIRSNS